MRSFIQGHSRIQGFRNRKYFGKGDGGMKGYVTASGYMGLVEGRYILFASEEDYREYME